MMTKQQRALFIIFGGTGDLAARKLYPALFFLYQKQYLAQNFAVIGTARRPWSDEHFQDVVVDAISDLCDDEQVKRDFASHFYYQSHNVTDTKHYQTLKQLADKLDQKYALAGNRICYLAMSPRFFETICSHLRSEGIADTQGFCRVIVEKPFGHDEQSAIELNNQISKYFNEDDVFRIDHYLGKDMVQNILSLRFANPLFVHNWNNRYIDNIQITLSESLGVEERAGYYETAGALRDMVQNHILQIVSLLTMNPPVSFSDSDIRREKIAALKALKRYDASEVAQNFVRGQYLGDNNGVAYRDEDAVASDSQTETFVAGKLEVQNFSFCGVPIYIRTGKKMAEKKSRIDVVFKQLKPNIFGDDSLARNVLTLEIEPNESITLQVNQKQGVQDFKLQPTQLSYTPSEQQKQNIPDSYEKLLLDALKGDATNFTHWQEVQYSWKFVDAIKNAWDKQSRQPYGYKPGSFGPRQSDDLLAADGNHWQYHQE